jgi:hypothetical protein
VPGRPVGATGVAGACVAKADTGAVTTQPTRARWSPVLVLVTVSAVGLSVAAFVVLDVIVALAVAVALLTGVALAFAASNWDQHSTFDEREQQRARRRKEKWERNAAARERDRRRWEAHRAAQPGPDGDR